MRPATELSEDIKATRSATPLLTLGLGTVATTIVSGILTEVAKVAWEIISGFRQVVDGLRPPHTPR